MVRLTDQETIAIVKIKAHLLFTVPKRKIVHTMQGTWGSTKATQETKSKGEAQAGTFIVVSIEKARQGKVSKLRIG